MSTLPPQWRQQEWKGCCMAKKFHLSMPLFVWLPDSQFLRWSHLSRGQTSSVNSMATMGLAHVNKAECAFICPCHLSLHFLRSTLCAGQVCSTHIGYVLTGLLQLEPVCVVVTQYFYLWSEVVLRSVTFWWQSWACNCSTLFMCSRSGLPHNVMHLSS